MPDSDELLARVRSTAELLEAIADDRGPLEQLPAGNGSGCSEAVAEFYHPDPVARRRRLKAAERERARRGQSASARCCRRRGSARCGGNRCSLRRMFFRRRVSKNTGAEAEESQHCYVCKQNYSAIHHFYDQMCPQCAEFNFLKRTELADLRGRVALLTGGRVKIGYQAG